jgi:cysteinyl-tRNA synthetase
MTRLAAARVLALTVVLTAVSCSRSAGHRPSRDAVPATSPTVPASSAPSSAPPVGLPSRSPASGSGTAITSWVYQLQGYPRGRLDALIRAPQQLAVIDLARDAHRDYFRPEEVQALRASGKVVLAYFEIGSIERFRPEYGPLRAQAGDLILNRWPDWPDEYFVRYWDPRWWDRVVRSRVDRAVSAGFDGVYLDTPLAYEELDLSMVPGAGRDALARRMAALIARISGYAKSRRSGMLVVPQNSPELRAYPGYQDAIDGIGMEELFFRATDQPCRADYCAENLADARALRDNGKFVLAVDYATEPDNIKAACGRYRDERFAGYVGVRDLDRISPPCP